MGQILGCAGTLATSTHRIDAMKYAACTKEEAQKIVEEATRGNVAPSYYRWSAAAVDVDRMTQHELYHAASCNL